MAKQRIILASSSLWRRELLKGLIGSNFIVREPSYVEDNGLKMQPSALAGHHALNKARSVAAKEKHGIIIGADTFVTIDGKILGKPKDAADAVRMLLAQSGRTTDVISGLAVIDIEGGIELVDTVLTKVCMKDISREEAEAYVATGEPLGRAGAFSCKEKGAVLIKSIDGDFYNIVGLPLCRLSEMLKKVGFDVFGSHEGNKYKWK